MIQPEPGGYPPVEVILMKRKKVIVQILRNLHFSVKMGKNSHGNKWIQTNTI